MAGPGAQEQKHIVSENKTRNDLKNITTFGKHSLYFSFDVIYG